MLDAAIGSGANVFITIAIIGIAIVGGIVNIDVLKEFSKKKED